MRTVFVYVNDGHMATGFSVGCVTPEGPLVRNKGKFKLNVRGGILQQMRLPSEMDWDVL